MQNVVFISASLSSLDFHSNAERTSQLRNKLLSLGLEFHSVRIDNAPYFMILTNQLSLAKQIALLYNQTNLYISDSRRQTFRLDLTGDTFVPTKLGTLTRTMSSNGSSVMGSAKPMPGAFCLSVYEDNQQYYYTTTR